MALTHGSRPVRNIRVLPFLGALLALSTVLFAAPASAAVFSVSKNICLGSPAFDAAPRCPLLTQVPINTQVSYVVTVVNPFGEPAQNVTLTDPYPTGFQVNSTVCQDNLGNAVVPTGSPIGTFVLAQDATVTCIVGGKFLQSGGTNVQKQNTVTASNGSLSLTASATVFVTNNTALGVDLKVEKFVSPSSITAPGVANYTIVVTNTGSNAVDVGHWFRLEDTLALKPMSVAMYAALQPGATCTTTGTGTQCLDSGGPTTYAAQPMFLPTMSQVGLFHWAFASGSNGHIAAGGTLTIKFSVKYTLLAGLTCVKAPNSDGAKNTAFFTLTNSDGTGASDSNPANNTASVPVSVDTGNGSNVDPHCGEGQLSIKKTETFGPPNPANPVGWSPPPANPPGTGRVHFDITIKNVSMPHQTIAITGGMLRDFVQEGPDAPPFTRSFISASCSGGPACAGFGGVASTPFGYAFYGQTALAWKTAAPYTISLAWNQTVVIHLVFDYSRPACDSVPNVSPKPVNNYAVVNYMATQVGAGSSSDPQISYQQIAEVTTRMQPPQACRFIVLKSLRGRDPVRFGVPLIYDVKFINNDLPRNIGTVMDAVRFTDPGYTTSLPYTANWTCTPSGGVTGSVGIGSITAGQVGYTVTPALGSRVMQQPSNIFFPTGGALTCVIKITVQRPSLNNPLCSTNQAYLENLGLMDTTHPYNPSLVWPPSGTYNAALASNPVPQNKNWATVRTPLPKCFNATINKTATPQWTWTPNGPAMNFTITVHNAGTSGVLTGSPNWNGLLVTDALTPNHVVTGSTPCPPNNSSVWCAGLAPLPAPSPTPVKIGVASLNAGANGVWHIFVNAPFAARTIYQNCAKLTPSGSFMGPDWYANYDVTQPRFSCASVPVVDVTDLNIVKKVVNQTGATIAPMTFGFSVTACTPYTLPATNVSLTTNTVATGTVHHVPVSDTCTVTESLPSIPTVAQRACGGSAVWDTVYSGSTVTPITGGAKVGMSPGPATVTATNTLHCKNGSVIILKKIDNQSAIQPPPGPFLVDVTCAPNPTVTVSLDATNGYQQTVNNVPQGSSCTLFEHPPAVPANLARQGCHWTTEYPGQTNSNSRMTIVTTPTRVVLNHWICRAQGHLELYKKVDNQTGDPSLVPATFPVTVHCSPGLFSASLPLHGNQGLGVAAAIAAGSTCTVHEPQLPVIMNVKACRGGSASWTTSYAPSSVVITAGGSALLTVVNTLTCDKTGSLNIFKKIDNQSPISPPNVPFLAQVHCTPNGPNVTVTLNAANGYQQTVNGVPAGSTCTTTELPPPVPANLAAMGCSWTTTYPGGNVAHFVPPHSGTVKQPIVNVWTCKGGRTGSLDIIKDVVSNGPVPPPATNFYVSYDCQPGGPTGSVTLNQGDNFQQVVSGIGVGKKCTIEEKTPAVTGVYDRLGCRWQTKYPDDQTVRIASGGNKITVINVWSCEKLIRPVEPKVEPKVEPRGGPDGVPSDDTGRRGRHRTRDDDTGNGVTPTPEKGSDRAGPLH